jgi:2'-5' RNA ligase
VPKTGAIDVTVRGLAWFPNPHHPRVLFAGITAGPELADLHCATDEACFAAGIPKELKKYSPHLTLARVDAGEGVAGVRAKIAGLPAADFGSFRAESFGLYESAMGKYTLLEEFPLL